MEKGQLEGQKNGETDFKAGKNDVEVHVAEKSDAYKQAFKSDLCSRMVFRRAEENAF